MHEGTLSYCRNKMERDDDHLWHLACAFSIVLNPSSRNLDVYKELARVDAIQNSKELPESDAIYQLQEHGLKIQGPGGKIVCTESGKWIYKRGSHFMKTSSLRFLGKSFSFRRGSTLSQDSEEHQHTQLGIANGESSHVKETSTPSLPPPKEFSLSFLKPRSFSLRHLSTASPPSSIELPEQSKVSSEENVAASTVSVSLSSPPELSSPRQPSSPLTSPKLPSSPPRRGLYSSASARTIGSLGDRSNRSVGSHRGSDRSIESGGDVFPSSPQASAALLTLEDRCAISMEAVFEELIPAMVILELFHELNAQWTGLVEDSIAANQRRMLERVNSRIGLYRTGSKLDLIRQENHLNAQPHSLPQSPSSRSLVDANGDVVDSEELNTELLQEMLFDIAQNALDMPSVLDEVEQEMQQQLEMQSSVERERERKQTAKAVQQEQSSGEDNAMHSAVKGKRVKSGHQKRGTPEEAVLAMLNRQQSDGMSFNAEDFCMTGEEAQEERKSGSMSPSNDEKSVGTKSAGSKSVGSRSETNDRTGKISGKGGPNVPTTSAAPVVPLRRPSWQSKVQPLYLTKKRRPSMAVRLALNEAGPFQRILKEGIPVIIHFAARGSSRPRRIKRLMVLDDGSSDVVGVDRMTNARNTGHFDDDGDTRSQSSGHGMLASGDSIPLSLANHHSSIHHQKLKFFRLESGEIIECDGEMVISEIADIVTGVHTIVFKHSLTQLHGEGMSYDKTGTEKRCFSMLMMNSKSPYDDRPVLDVEIQPMDKQKPEVGHKYIR